MNPKEILIIVALLILGICLLCGIFTMTMKGHKAKQTCNHACSLSLFVAVVLVGVSQLLNEQDDFTASPTPTHYSGRPYSPVGSGCQCFPDQTGPYKSADDCLKTCNKSPISPAPKPTPWYPWCDPGGKNPLPSMKDCYSTQKLTVGPWLIDGITTEDECDNFINSAWDGHVCNAYPSIEWAPADNKKIDAKIMGIPSLPAYLGKNFPWPRNL